MTTIKAQNAPAVCDICKAALTQGWADAGIPARGGSWGNLCFQCARRNGVSYGIGRGQRYERLYPGSDFVLVEGGRQ